MSFCLQLFLWFLSNLPDDFVHVCVVSKTHVFCYDGERVVETFDQIFKNYDSAWC